MHSSQTKSMQNQNVAALFFGKRKIEYDLRIPSKKKRVGSSDELTKKENCTLAQENASLKLQLDTLEKTHKHFLGKDIAGLSLGELQKIYSQQLAASCAVKLLIEKVLICGYKGFIS